MTRNPAIPANYQTVMPYLILKDAAKFIDFVKDVFGAEETHRTMGDDTIVMHAEVRLGESTIMISDATDTYTPNTAGLFVYVDDADARYQKALEAGATAVTSVSDQPYGRSGGVKDPFGNIWWITSLKRADNIQVI